MTLFNVEYRLCPEHKAPAGIYDAYAALNHGKYVIDNSTQLGVDKDRIATFGESGGGWITTGVGMMLAERNESSNWRSFPRQATTSCKKSIVLRLNGTS